jgi:hypothetical protein
MGTADRLGCKESFATRRPAGRGQVTGDEVLWSIEAAVLERRVIAAAAVLALDRE